MAETEPEQAKREFLAGVAPWADTFSKAVAGVAIAVYACGFLIVSLYHSKFGFVGTNPFRPRVLAAGVWFIFFTAIPVLLATRYRKYSWMDIARESSILWVVCLTLSASLYPMLFEFSADSMFRVRFWLVSGGLFAIVFALIVASYKRKAPAWVATISSVLLTVFYVSDPVWRYFHKGGLGIGSLALWFFAGTLVAILEFKGERFREYPTAYERWSTPLFALFGLLLAFATTVYPQLKASWGGGTPANVTVYFTRGSLLSPNKAVQAQLVEESDEGFYIVGPKESKAIFVTRKDVALVYFSDKAAESPLMQGIK